MSELKRSLSFCVVVVKVYVCYVKPQKNIFRSNFNCQCKIHKKKHSIHTSHEKYVNKVKPKKKKKK